MAQFAVDNADNINIEGCEFACLGSAAISMIDSVSNSSINGNIIRDISGTGIRVGHPTHNRQRDGVEVCSNIDVTNNVIRRIAGEMFNNSGITVYYEKFINILHNDIENVPYSGMSIGWGWGGGAAYDHSDIDVSYNRIQNVMNSLSDGGGIYTLGPIKNGVISNNYLADHNAGHGGLIYNDEGSAYIEVYNNVALNGLQTHLITNANNLDAPTKNLTIYDNYSDTGYHSTIGANAIAKGIDFEEYTIVTGKGETLNNDGAKAIYRNSGLESEYQSLLSKAGVNLPAGGREISSTLPASVPKLGGVLNADEYDPFASSINLERVEYPDGIGVVLNGNQHINYKLYIEKAGYYKIVLRARQADVSGANIVNIGGDASNVTMHLNDGRKINDKTADKNYRVCTAYFEAGEQDLLISLQYANSGIIIRELQYSPIEQVIEPDKVNLIKLKDYHNYTSSSGRYYNAYENDQSGYTSEGSGELVAGCITTPTDETVTLTYDINVKEAGTYKIDAASWLMYAAEYTVTVGNNTITGRSPQYNSLHKTDVTTIGNITLPAGESTLTFKCKMPSGSGDGANAYMFYLTLEKQN